MNYHRLPIGKEAPQVVRCIIEIAKDTNTKFEFDEEYNTFVLDRVLLSSMLYPANYGFLPSTHAEDGDPLDVMVLMNNSMPPGTVVMARPVGVLDMTDGGKKDYKVLAVPVFQRNPALEIEDVDQVFLMIARNFFKGYKELEGKHVEIGEWLNRQEAYRIIEEACRSYDRYNEMEF
jgi:inorganic pyrophosphatase